ncbi:DinB family protein [Hoeflea sp.]|uniref:DinB family protein n=1 Tax=Hoeflea sp. TaxID=1940281 RepID=UPI003B02E00A
MPNKEYVTTMARYNMWQNQSLLAAADSLSAAEREKDRGAFFDSIHKTLSHIFWGDMIWMHRFAGTPAPDGGITDSTGFIRSWAQYLNDREAFDKTILEWAHDVDPDWFEGDLTWYSGAIGRELTKPKKILIMQLFNHQTHHRGQVHAMLTAAGAKPEDTDIPFMPDRFGNL